MLFNVFSLDMKKHIAQVKAESITDAWDIARKKYGEVGDVAGFDDPWPLQFLVALHGEKKGKEIYERQFITKPEDIEPSGIIYTVLLPLNTQRNIIHFLDELVGKKVEYQLQLLLENGTIKPGKIIRGSPERVRVIEGIGSFHTHPGAPTIEVSKGDIITLLGGNTKVVGVGIPGNYSVQFASKIRYPSERMVKILSYLPIDGEVEFTGLEEYCKFYNFTLDISDIIMEIII